MRWSRAFGCALLLVAPAACDSEDDNVQSCETLADCPDGFLSCINGLCSKNPRLVPDRGGQPPPPVDAGPDAAPRPDAAPDPCDVCEAGLVCLQPTADELLCCPPNAVRPGDPVGCCPEAEIGLSWENGETGCCPQEASLPRYDPSGATACCPAATPEALLAADGRQHCCESPDMVAVPYPDDTLGCCPADQPSPVEHDDGARRCCPADHPNFGSPAPGRYGCCPAEEVVVLFPSGPDCCPEATPVAVVGAGGSGLCCAEGEIACPEGDQCCPGP